MSHSDFSFSLPITGYEIRKSADGAEKYVITGMASNTGIDLTGERMAASAIQSMVKSVQDHPVAINNEHSHDWDADFGELTKAWATPNNELMVEAELNPDNYRTATLIKALNKGKKLGLSIGGRVLDAANEWVEELHRNVLTYKDIDIFHVAITGTPAVADTWVNAISKSIKDGRDLPMTTNKAAANWKVGAARDLAIIDEAWDGQDAKDSIFSWAGWPDNPDPSKAKQAFLAYDAANDDLKGAYKLPFAKVVDGALKAVRAGLDNAASRLPQTDIPQAVRDDARKVIDGYEKKETTKSDESQPENVVEQVAQDAVDVSPEVAPVIEQIAEAAPVVEPVVAPAEAEAVVETPADAAPTEAVTEEVVEETPAEPVVDATSEEEAVVEPEAPVADAAHEDAITPAVEADPAAQDAAPELATPVTPEVAPQEAEAPASVDAAPETTSEDTSEVAKSEIFGEYTEPAMVCDTICDLSNTLANYVFNTMLNDDLSADEQKAAVAAALAEYSRLVTTVANELIDAEAKEDAAEAVKALQAAKPEVVAKTISGMTANIEELHKSLALKDEEIESITKTLNATRDDLEKATKQIKTMDARKQVIMANKFGPDTQLGAIEDSEAEAVKKAWLNIITGGRK